MCTMSIVCKKKYYEYAQQKLSYKQSPLMRAIYTHTFFVSKKKNKSQQSYL